MNNGKVIKPTANPTLNFLTGVMLTLATGFVVGYSVGTQRQHTTDALEFATNVAPLESDLNVTTDSLLHAACYMRPKSRRELGCLPLDSTNRHTIGLPAVVLNQFMRGQLLDKANANAPVCRERGT